MSGVGESQRFQGEGMENQCDYNYYDNNGFLRCHPLVFLSSLSPFPDPARDCYSQIQQNSIFFFFFKG